MRSWLQSCPSDLCFSATTRAFVLYGYQGIGVWLIKFRVRGKLGVGNGELGKGNAEGWWCRMFLLRVPQAAAIALKHPSNGHYGLH